MQTINSPAITSGHTEATIQNGPSYTDGPSANVTGSSDHPSKNLELHETHPLSNKRRRILSFAEDDSVEPSHTILERDQDSDFQDEQFLSDLQSGLREDRFEYILHLDDASIHDTPPVWVNHEDLGNVEFQGVMEALVFVNGDIVYEELGVQDENGHIHELQNDEDEQVDLPDLNEDPIHQLDECDEFDNVLEMDFNDIFQGLDDNQL